jgi:MYXO-CTERM domain-containing protein
VSVRPTERLVVEDGWLPRWPFAEPLAAGRVDVFHTDGAGLAAALGGQDFAATAAAEGVAEARTFDLDLPAAGEAHLLVANRGPLNLWQRVELRWTLADRPPDPGAGTGCAAAAGPRPGGRALAWLAVALAIAGWRRRSRKDSPR